MHAAVMLPNWHVLIQVVWVSCNLTSSFRISKAPGHNNFRWNCIERNSLLVNELRIEEKNIDIEMSNYRLHDSMHIPFVVVHILVNLCPSIL